MTNKHKIALSLSALVVVGSLSMALLIVLLCMFTQPVSVKRIIYHVECIIYKYKPVEFFKIEEWRFENGDSIILIEDFVVSNPPRTKLLLKEIVEKHTFKTLPPDTLKKYTRYTRHLFRETACLTRNYKEGEPYPDVPLWSLEGGLTLGCFYGGGQNLRFHHDTNDHIATFHYYYFPIDNYWEYDYNHGHRHLRNGNRTKIEDIDSFFMVGKDNGNDK